MIKALSELLVDIGLCSTQRKAVSKIKNGHVYVDNIRVANTNALLVITRGATIEIRDENIKKEISPCS